MSAWASPAVVPQGPGLREIMDAEEVNQTRRLADESDEALQLALRVSAVSSTPQGMACSVCTFMNEKTAATACEMCGSSLAGNSSDATQHMVSVDADLALALRLAQQEEASTQNNQNNDSLTQARADPMWQARHGVVSSDMYCQDESEGSFKLVDDVGEGNVPPVDPRAYGVEYITLEDGRIVTKHDPVINGRQNSRHAEEHLPCMGDLSGAARKGHSHKEIRLPNTAFNAMRREVKKSMDGGVKKGVAQRGRVATEQRATREGVLDLGTRQLLLKLINKGALEEITGVVNAGKEARVFYGVGNRAALLRSGGANEDEEDEEEDEDQGAEGAALSWSDGEEVEEGGRTFSRDGGDGERVVEEEAEGEAEAEDALGVVVQEAANAASGQPEEQEVEYLFQAPSHRKRAPDPSAAESADDASKAENPGCGRAEDAGETTTTTTGSQLDLSELQVLVRSAKLTGERQRPSESPQEARQGATPSHPSSLPHPAAGSPSSSMGVAVKVFFTSLDQFSKRVDYINGDSRYRGRNMSRLTKRRLVTLWCDKEYRNLVRAYRSGVPCPTPLAHTGHVLLMSFLPEEQQEEVEDGTVEEQGDEVEDSSASATDALSPCAASSTASDGPPACPSSSSDAAGVLNEGDEKEGPWEWTPAPQLHQVPLAALSSKAWMRCYLQALACCRTLYQRAHLVHGDLSEYNLLLTRTTRPPKRKKTEEEEGKQGREEEAGGGGGLGRQHPQRTQPRVQVIDLGQAVVRSHPHAAELLRRDLANVLAFFAKRKVPVHSLPVCEAFVKDPHALPEDGAHAHAHLTYGRAKKAAASSKEEAECGAALRSQHRGGSGDEDCVSAALDRITKGEEEIASAVRNALASVREGEVATPGV